MIRKMTGLIDREEVRKEVGNEIAGLSLISDPEEFKELLSRFIRFSDGVEVLKDKWRIIYNNSKSPLELIGILTQDDDIRKDMLSDMNYLINYGEVDNTGNLAREISKVEGGNEAISNNFEKLLNLCDDNADCIAIPALETEIGRKKVKENFGYIKDKFFPNVDRSNLDDFFKLVRALKGIDDFKEIYEDYSFWADLYDQIEVPEPKKPTLDEILKAGKNEAAKLHGDFIAKDIKKQEFAIMMYSKDREEKKLILQKVANGNKYKYKSCGTQSFIIQAGDQVVKLGAKKRKFEIPYHPLIMMPYFRKAYSDDSVLEVFNFGNVKSAKITDEKLLEMYKELEKSGIKWTDARKDNVLELLEDNVLPDYIREESKDFNLFGFLKDSRFPTNEHKVLKKGDIVICDLDMLYAKDDPDYEDGLLDDVIMNYLLKKINSKDFDDEDFSH